jgi:hypothetical protein
MDLGVLDCGEFPVRGEQFSDPVQHAGVGAVVCGERLIFGESRKASIDARTVGLPAARLCPAGVCSFVAVAAMDGPSPSWWNWAAKPGGSTSRNKRSGPRSRHYARSKRSVIKRAHPHAASALTAAHHTH